MKKMHQVELLGGRQIVLRGLSLFAGSLLACTFAFAQNSIQPLTGSVQSGAEVIRIETAEPLSAVPSGFTIQSPARIALDFPGVVNGIGRSALDIGQGNIRSANVVQAGDRTRVVINLKQPSTYQAKLDGRTLLLVLDGSSSASPTSVAQAAPAAAFAPSGNVDPAALKDIDFRRGVGNSGRVVVELANNQTGVDIRQQGKDLVVDFLKTTLPEGLRRKLDVTDFGTPVQSVVTSQVGDRVRMLVTPTGLWEHSAYQSDNQFVLEIREQKLDPSKLTQGPGYNGEKLSLNFQNIEVRSLLQVIADFTNFNAFVMVAERRNDRKVKADLFEYRCPYDRMYLGFFDLGGRWFVWFAQDMIGNGELADVVEQSPCSQSVDLIFGQAQDLSQPNRIYLCAADMADVDLVASIDRSRESLDRCHVNLVKFGQPTGLMLDTLDMRSVTYRSQTEQEAHHYQASVN